MSGVPGGQWEQCCNAEIQHQPANIAKRASGITELRCTRKGAEEYGGRCYQHRESS